MNTTTPHQAQHLNSTDAFAGVFKALSNPNRLKIFIRLINCCNPGTRCSSDKIQKFCVGDLGDELDVSPSTLSHHMKELNRAGLIEMQRRGQHIDCWVEPDTVNQLKSFFDIES
jgi:ArsR family transcriptional regulator